MKLKLGISPCPNDTFIFDAMLHGKIDTEGIEFEYILEDVETLNKMALSASLDVSKVSYGVVPKLLANYRLLDAGGALGKGVGPLFISKNKDILASNTLHELSVVLPGMHTTAHLLFSLAFPEIRKKIFLPFHEIENAVLSGMADTGVIIHENRFTYASKGLNKLADLGDIWETNTGLPIPLGGIVSRRSFDVALSRKINKIIRSSLVYAFENMEVLPPFVTDNAQEMEESVMRKHIDLYVNDFSLGLGSSGRSAVWNLLEASTILYPEPAGGNFEVFLD
jgi:1,4-dihydroxy-6-naphthoate synthase